MSETKTAEEILQSKISTTTWNFLHHVLHSGEVYKQILVSHEEYANQQNQELQRQLAERNKQIDGLHIVKAELQRQVDELSKANNDAHSYLDEMNLEYTKLKEAADEMYNELEGWDEHCDAIEIYKHLTNKP